jgi:hypothetical protein
MNHGTGTRDTQNIFSACHYSVFIDLGIRPATVVLLSAIQDFIPILRNHTTRISPTDFYSSEQAMKTKYDQIDPSGPGSTRGWLRNLLTQRQAQNQDVTEYGRNTNAPPPYETASLFAERPSRLKPGAMEDFYDHLPETSNPERHESVETCCVKVQRILQEFKSFSTPTFSKVLAIIPGRDIGRFRDFLYRQLRSEYTPSLILEAKPSADDRYFHSLGQVLCSDSSHQRLFGSRTLNGTLQHELNKYLEAHYYKHVRVLCLDEYHVRRTIISASRVSRNSARWLYLVEGMAEKGAFETILTKLENDLKTLDVTAPSYDEEAKEEVRSAIVALRARYFDIDAVGQAVQLTRFARMRLCPNCSCNQNVILEETSLMD